MSNYGSYNSKYFRLDSQLLFLYYILIQVKSNCNRVCCMFSPCILGGLSQLLKQYLVQIIYELIMFCTYIGFY